MFVCVFIVCSALLYVLNMLVVQWGIGHYGTQWGMLGRHITYWMQERPLSSMFPTCSDYGRIVRTVLQSKSRMLYQNHLVHRFCSFPDEGLCGFSNQWDEINFSDQVAQLLTMLDSKSGFIRGLLRTGIPEQSYIMVWLGHPGNSPCSYSFSYPTSP